MQLAVERAPPPQDARGDLVGQAAVPLAEPGDGAVARGVEQLAGADRSQDVPGGQPGLRAGAGRAQSSIPAVGLEGTAVSRRGIRPAR